MPKTVAKRDLPTKTCPVCGRPFAWRKKWAKVWDEVRYCSDRCRTDARGQERGKEGVRTTTSDRPANTTNRP